MAAPAIGAIGTYLSGAMRTSSPVPVPAGVAVGDVVVLHYYTEDGSGTLTFPSGFTVKADLIATNHRQTVAWKRATAADTGTYAIGNSNSNWSEAVAIRYTGCVTTGDPFDGTVGTATGTAATSPAVSTTTATADTLLVWSATNFNGGAWTPPTSFTERVDAGSDLSVATLGKPATGTSGTVTGTCAGGAAQSTAFIGALIPAVTSTPSPSFTDSGGSTDSVTAVTTRLRVIDDGVGSTDVGLSVAQAHILSDSAGSTDALGGLPLATTRTDSAGSTDTVTPTLLQGSPVITDSTGSTDSVAVTLQLTSTDTAGSTDAGQTQGRVGATTDSAGSTDSVLVVRVIADPAGSTDTVATPTAKALTDTAGSTDAGTRMSRAGTWTDEAGSTDTVVPTITTAGTRTITDTAGSTDTVTPTLVQAGATVVTDSAGSTDAGVLTGRRGTRTDVAGSTDAVSFTLGPPAADRTISDLAGSTDAGLLRGRAGTWTDPAGSTDSITVIRARIVVVTDQAGSSDAGYTQAVAERLDDTAGATDSVLSQAGAGPQTLTDLSGSADGVLVTLVRGPRVVTDSAGSTDAVAFVLSQGPDDETPGVALTAVLDITGRPGTPIARIAVTTGASIRVWAKVTEVSGADLGAVPLQVAIVRIGSRPTAGSWLAPDGREGSGRTARLGLQVSAQLIPVRGYWQLWVRSPAVQDPSPVPVRGLIHTS